MLSFPVSVNFSFSFHLIVEPDPHCSYLVCCSIPSSWATYHVFLTQWLMKRNKFKEVEGLKRNNWDVISHTFFSTVCVVFAARVNTYPLPLILILLLTELCYSTGNILLPSCFSAFELIVYLSQQFICTGGTLTIHNMWCFPRAKRSDKPTSF